MQTLDSSVDILTTLIVLITFLWPYGSLTLLITYLLVKYVWLSDESKKQQVLKFIERLDIPNKVANLYKIFLPSPIVTTTHDVVNKQTQQDVKNNQQYSSTEFPTNLSEKQYYTK
jgi:hypothetical protein